ncbi:alpha/beta fold hydrolase [Undibacterium terreum]|uniref:Hydrolase, alpha/beta fold protein n=1 Tax=Undibacterium terreum TaxID=1224302 RepID=A0A916V2D7_9BURK|nr:alpha/beta hydrolase [Undibacterium terreum]GGD01375.1 putative hydrolase, alpha/beta fold protein [Undibacterium terreum]
MPYANNDGTKIYYETHGHSQGEAIVLLHGFSSSSKQWQMTGYVAALERYYRVILIDLRGHGLSDKPHDHDAYALEKRIDDVRAVLAELAVQRCHVLAYSMGGWLAFGLALRYPQLVATLIIGGAHPYADSLSAFAALDGSDPDAFISALENFIGETVSKEARPFILHNDLAALAAAARDRDGYQPRLAEITAPLMLFSGDGDRRLPTIEKAAKDLHAEKLLIVPGTNHASTLFAAKALLPDIIAFLQQH